MRKWLAGILASIVAAVAVWWLTHPGGPLNPVTPTPPPEPRLSFLEKVSGNYQLFSWIQVPRPIVMGVSVKDGTLRIATTGDADWELGIWDSGAHPGAPSEAKSRIKCGGMVSSASQQLIWAPGGQRNVAIDWERGIESVRDMVWLAFCGGRITGSTAPFALHLDEQSGGRKILEMENSEGVFRWTRSN